MVITGSFLLSCPAVCAQKREPKLPNIIIVYADDMGWGDIASQNPESKIPTPHLDRLAAEGMRFTDGHSSASVCSPSRYAMLTGRYHWRINMHGVVPVYGNTHFNIEPRLTLPEMLGKCNYHTACIGKWHLGWDWGGLFLGDDKKPASLREASADMFDWTRRISEGPIDHGFDYYFGDDIPNMPPYTWIENDRVLVPPTETFEPQPAVAEGNHDCRPGLAAPGWRLDAVMPRLTERAISWVEEQAQQDHPFFLYWSWTSPHTPISPSPEFIGSTEAGGYGDYVHQSDASLGRLLKELEKQQLLDNTLIVFTADNGAEKFSYERARKYNHRSMGPLRGTKSDLWEAGHRLPFIVWWPGQVPANTVSDSLVSQVDIFATVAAVVGFPLSEDMAEDSHNLLPLWRSGKTSDNPRRSIVHSASKNQFALRRGPWIYYDCPDGERKVPPKGWNQENGFEESDQPFALYNLDEDIGQRRNRYRDKIDLAKGMQEELHQMTSDTATVSH